MVRLVFEDTPGEDERARCRCGNPVAGKVGSRGSAVTQQTALPVRRASEVAVTRSV